MDMSWKKRTQQKHSHTKRKTDNLGNLSVTCFRASDDSTVAMLLSQNEECPTH